RDRIVFAPPHVIVVVVVPSSLFRAVPTADQKRSVPSFQPTTWWGLAVPSATRSAVVRSSVRRPLIHGLTPTDSWKRMAYWLSLDGSWYRTPAPPMNDD